jgi:hypothetical protein
LARLVLEDLAAWAAGTPIVWLALQDEIDRFESLLGRRGAWRKLGELDLPTPTSPMLEALGRDPLEKNPPYWVIEPPLHAWRLIEGYLPPR